MTGKRVYSVDNCPTCRGRGDTGPPWDPDPCGVCRGTGNVPCDYCGKPSREMSLIGTYYCSLECLCRYNAKRQAVLDFDTYTDFMSLPEEE